MAAPYDTPESAEKDFEIVRLIKDGHTFREAAKIVGLTVSNVYRRYQRGLQRIGMPTVNEYRDNQLTRIQSEREIIQGILTQFHVTVSNGRVFTDLEDVGPLMSAVDRLIKLDEQEAKLLGLQAPTKVAVDAEVNYTVGGGVDPGAMT